ncbi:uncharacterized protein LOC103716837 [Phoenix dactylifera]|uniref:Uncharacterized protein LOC103716837 n=1 Tax=Phoenix dactylifera TaxID=42345 RepID=A0A8B7CNX8_PHODC|nr:uncharacterized protein LOC103716837 [Phoenix dactylifera]
MRSTRRCLMICCLVAAVIIILLVVTFVILYFTMFKPKQPEVVAKPVYLRNMEFGLLPVPTLNVSLGLDVFVKNQNRAGFKYDNTTTSIYYRGVLVGVASIEAGTIDARATDVIPTVADLQAGKIILNPSFLPDVVSGSLNFTSSSNLEGDVILLDIFKLHASTRVSCDISVFLMTSSISSTCHSKVKI